MTTKNEELHNKAEDVINAYFGDTTVSRLRKRDGLIFLKDAIDTLIESLDVEMVPRAERLRAAAVADLIANPHALHRYLSRLVLPPVERVDDECALRYVSGASVVYGGPYGISPRSRVSTPQEALALAACLLAAADEAAGTVWP